MSKPLPTGEQVLTLLHKNGCPQQVISHCRAVSRLAADTAVRLQRRGYEVDVEFVKVAALLHDIGRSKTQNVDHVIKGVEIAKAEGLSEPLIAAIRCHVGGGITKEEAKALGWPNADYMPITLEQKIVSFADKLVETDNERIPVEETIAKFQSRGLTASAERVRRLHDEIATMLGEKQ